MSDQRLRIGVGAVLVALMVAFGFGVYHALDSQKKLHTTVQQPNQSKFEAVQGTMYVAQGGALYRFRGGTFTKLTSAEGWMQPSLSPDGARLVAVKRAFNHSDLYELDTSGHVQQQLTHNASSVVERNHWAFFPRFAADGQSIFFSYDPKDPYNSYRVDLAIYSMAPGQAPPGRDWSRPNEYTGGDVVPIPLKSGALVYAKNSIDNAGKVHSQVWIQARAGSAGAQLTPPEDDCGQPSVSADGAQLAMTCRHGQPNADVEVASLNAAGFSLSERHVVVPAGLNAAPAFAPDGRSLAYFAPSGAYGPFQLWTVSLAAPAPAPSGASAAPSPPAPKEITRNLGLDSSAAPAWA